MILMTIYLLIFTLAAIPLIRRQRVVEDAFLEINALREAFKQEITLMDLNREEVEIGMELLSHLALLSVEVGSGQAQVKVRFNGNDDHEEPPSRLSHASQEFKEVYGKYFFTSILLVMRLEFYGRPYMPMSWVYSFISWSILKTRKGAPTLGFVLKRQDTKAAAYIETSGSKVDFPKHLNLA